MVTTYTENNLNQTITFKSLYRADRTIKVPFNIVLDDHNEPLTCEHIIRILPKNRLLAFGKWGEKEVAIKLFYENRKAKEHARRDAFGIESLMQYNVPTAKLLYKGFIENGKIHILIFEKINQAISLEKLWRNKERLADIEGLLKAVTIELATQHVLGILQRDLHLNNFLVTEKNIYTLDGGQIDCFDYPLEKKISMDYLALFLVQLGVGEEQLQNQLFDTYTQSRGWIVKPADSKTFKKLLIQQAATRLQKFKKKIFRNCSQFQRIDKYNKTIIYDKSYDSMEFRHLLKNPDVYINHPNAQFLKKGGSSTVVKVVIDEKPFVIKRYNYKDIWQWLRRMLSMSRAKRSWRISQQFYSSGLLTPMPVAFIENHFMGLLGKSYFIMEYVEGLHLSDYFKLHKNNIIQCERMVVDSLALLRNMLKLRITQGDLKMTNILVYKEKPYIIDFDGAKEHIYTFRLHRAFKNELKRFFKNWENHPEIFALYSKEMSNEAK